MIPLNWADVGAAALIAGLVASVSAIVAGALGARTGDDQLLRAEIGRAHV